MTKQVRIENADGSTYPVRVTVQHKGVDGSWVDQPGSIQLDYPTKMTENYLTSTRRLVIAERAADPVVAV